jgi:hypothetical protein
MARTCTLHAERLRRPRIPTTKSVAQGVVRRVAETGNVLGGILTFGGIAVVLGTWAIGQPIIAVAFVVLASLLLNVALAVALLRRSPTPTAGPVFVPDLPPPTGAAAPAPPVPVWFAAKGDPSSITMTNNDLDQFATEAHAAAVNVLGPDASTRFNAFQIYVAKDFLPTVNLYFDSVSVPAMKKVSVQFSLWATTRPGIAAIEKLGVATDADDKPDALRPWIKDGSWRDLLRLAWTAERPFSGSIYLHPVEEPPPGGAAWTCTVNPELEGIKHPSVKFKIKDGVLARL